MSGVALSPHLEDPVTFELMKDAVMLFPCGHSLSAEIAQKCLQENGQCPLDRQRIEGYKPNYTVRGIVDDYSALLNRVPLPSIAFGAAEWRKYFGNVGVEPPLPPNIEEILNASSPCWPGKKIRETHMLTLVPKLVNKKPLNLKLLGKLIQNPLQGHKTKYDVFNIGDYQDLPNSTSCWVLMAREVPPQSLHGRQEAINAPGEVPRILDAVVSICMEYVRTGTHLYGPWNQTLCQEKFGVDAPLTVGWFSSRGLIINCVLSMMLPYNSGAHIGVSSSCRL